MAAFYGVYHGPDGLRKIANRVHNMAVATGKERGERRLVTVGDYLKQICQSVCLSVYEFELLGILHTPLRYHPRSLLFWPSLLLSTSTSSNITYLTLLPCFPLFDLPFIAVLSS